MGLKARRKAAGQQSPGSGAAAAAVAADGAGRGLPPGAGRSPCCCARSLTRPGAKGGASRGRGWLRRRRRRPARAPSPNMSPNYMRSFSEGCVSTRGRTWGQSRERGVRPQTATHPRRVPRPLVLDVFLHRPARQQGFPGRDTTPAERGLPGC